MIGEEEDTRLPGDDDPFGDGEVNLADMFDYTVRLSATQEARFLRQPKEVILAQVDMRASDVAVAFLTKKLHPRCVGQAACVRIHGELAINAEEKCAGCGVAWFLADPRGTRRTTGRSDSVQ